MRTKTIDKLCCPFDKSDIELTIITKDVEENVLEGFLACTHCKRIYPIVKGIPIMNPDDYREFELEKPLLEKFEAHLKGKKIENFRLVSNEEMNSDS